MPPAPELRYDEDDRRILLDSEDGCLELYTDADRSEFDFVKAVAACEMRASGLFERIHDVTLEQQALVTKGEYFESLYTLQQKAGESYVKCLELQNQSESADSEIVATQAQRLYKVEKLLKHYFRCLAVAQSLGFSQRLSSQHQVTGDHVYLFGFVRNACSTIEFLGTHIENRDGEGTLNIESTGSNFKDVYEELMSQELDDVLSEDQTLTIPPNDETMRMGDIGLSTGSMEYIRQKRNEIVHHCPLVVSTEIATRLPDEVLSTSILTTEDIKKLTHLTTRLHFLSLALFHNLTLSYLHDMLDRMFDAWGTGGTPSPVDL